MQFHEKDVDDFLQDYAPPRNEAKPPVAKDGGVAAEADETKDAFSCPVTGELVSELSVDEMWECYERVSAALEVFNAATARIRAAYGALVRGGTGNTRRARGLKHTVKVTLPSLEFHKPTLKELWESAADKPYRSELLRVESVAVNKRELAKAVGTAGPEDYEAFVKAIAAAEFSPTRPPTISLDGSQAKSK